MRNTLALLSGLISSLLILIIFGGVIKPLFIFLFYHEELSWISERMLMITGWATSISLSWMLVDYISVKKSMFLVNIFFGLWSLFFLGMGILMCYLLIGTEVYAEFRWFEIVGVLIELLLTFGFSFIVFQKRKDIASGDFF
jgi:hypothetical protein